MNTLSIIITALFILLLAGFIFFLSSAIIFNMKLGQKYRQSLAEKVNQLRLGRMLTALGIDVNSYLHSERVLDIKEQLSRCGECANTDQCDDRLSEGMVDAREIDFCNNESSLKEMIKDRQAAE